MTALVNPPGFDMNNAMSLDDVDVVTDVFARAYFRNAGSVVGRVLIEDRHASMSDYRDNLAFVVRHGTVAFNVMADIDWAISKGFDQRSDAIY